MLIGFPQGGLDRKVAYRQRRPFATNDCLNVRPMETIENRDRGGSRPGLEGRDGGRERLGSEIRLLSPMTLINNRKARIGGDGAGGSEDSVFTLLRNRFTGTELSDDWGEQGPPYLGFQNYPLPTLSGTGLAGTSSNQERSVDTAHIFTSLDVAQRYTIRMYIEPHEGRIRNTVYNIQARLSNIAEEPRFRQDGVAISMWLNDSEGYMHWHWSSFANGSIELGTSHTTDDYVLEDDTVGDWWNVTYESNTLVSTSFGGRTETINMAHSNHSGSRVGFTLHGGSLDPPHPRPWISAYDIHGYMAPGEEELGVDGLFRTLLVGSAGGNLYSEWQS